MGQASWREGRAVFDGAKPACKVCQNANKNALDNFGAKGSVAGEGLASYPEGDARQDRQEGPQAGLWSDKISDPDLDALADYLVSLKK